MGKITPLKGSLKTLNITYQTPQESLLVPAQTLPTSEPAVRQVSYTVVSGDLPSLSMNIYSQVWVAILRVGGKCVTAGTIYYRMYKNNVSVRVGSSSVAANTYYTWNIQYLDVAINDLLEVALWSSVTDSQYDYKAYQIQMTRFNLLKVKRYAPFMYNTHAAHPVLTLGTPGVYLTETGFLFFDDIRLTPTVGRTWQLMNNLTLGCFQLSQGDRYNADGGVILTHTTYRPYYYRNNCPTQIKFRGLYID